ncbi:MAG: signal peptidase II [bacterium]
MTKAKTEKQGLQLSRRIGLLKKQAGRNPMFKPALLVTLAVLVLDQLSKNWVLYFTSLGGKYCTPKTEGFCGHIELSQIFDLTMVWNDGVSFGLFAGGLSSRILLSALAISVATGLLTWLCGLKRPIAAIGIGFIIGGALGNVFDRVLYGAVIDFLDFSGIYHPWFEIKWPIYTPIFNFEWQTPFIKFGMYPFRWVFNIADVAVNIGIACLAYDAFFAQRHKTSAT